ncbi:MAG: ABC transporter ATP-binding protein [Synergistaceae bacterium]|nr:ABC transporter ATP-binding protein [Synergistaceae bacterium]
MKNLYEIKNLVLSYENESILKDISLKIPCGLVSLIGPNGAGKTSLLRVLAGLEKRYSGKILLNNAEINKISRKKMSRALSFVMSNKNFRPLYSFSVKEIIALGRLPFTGMFGFPKNHDNELIEKAAELLKISHLLNRDIMTLSDGERQLVFIASAIAQDTKIILLDEPTASLDPDKAAGIFALLKELAGKERNIIAAVHDINIATEYSDFYIAIKNGELIFNGKELNQEILRDLYGVDFVLDLMWRVKN